MSSLYNHRQMHPTAGASRVHEYLDQIRQEYDQLCQEMVCLKSQREELDQKTMTQQMQEMALVKQTLAELEHNQAKIKQQYEEEIMRLRREIEMLRTNGASNPNPVPQQIPPQIGQHHSTLFSSVAPGGGPALPPQPTANNESQHGGYYNASMQPQQPYAKRPRVEGEPAPGPSNYTSQHISPPSGSNASTAQSIPKSQPTSQPTAVRRTPVEMETETNTIKHESGDWSVSFNPRTKQVLNVRLVHTLQHDTVVCCVNFSHDGKYLATGCNRTAQIFSVATGQRVDVLTDESVTREGDLYIRSVCFSPDGKYLATGAEDQRIRIWDLSKKQIRCVLHGHTQDIYSLDYSRDGRLIVSGSGDRTARIWDVETGQALHTLHVEDHGSRDAGVTSVAFSPDGKYIAAGSLDRMVRVWNVQTGEFIEYFEGHRDSVYSVVFAPDGKHLVSGSLDRTIKMWELGRGSVQGGKPNPNACKMTFTGHKDFVLSVACSPCGRWIVSGSKDRSVQFWDPHTAQPQFILQGHKNSVISVAISPQSTMFATGSGDCRARIWSHEHVNTMAPGQ